MCTVFTHDRPAVAEQLSQIFNQLRQEYPTLWNLACERAFTELLITADDECGTVVAAEAKEQIGLWHQSETADDRRKREYVDSKSEGKSKDKQRESATSWVDNPDLLERSFIIERQGCGYDATGFLG